ARVEQLRVRGDHRRIRRAAKPNRHRVRKPADGASLSGRRAGAAISQPAVVDRKGLPGDAAALPAWRRRLRRLQASLVRRFERAIIEPGILTSILASTLVAGTPLILAALGELVTERSGVLNLGAEGLMSIGAVAGFAAAYHSDSATIGALAGVIA